MKYFAPGMLYASSLLVAFQGYVFLTLWLLLCATGTFYLAFDRSR